MIKLLALILLCITEVYPHNIIDSLKSKLNSTQNGIEKVDILNRLSFEYVWKHTDSAIILANQSLKLSEENEYRKGLPSAYRSLSLAEKLKGNFNKAIEFAKKAIELYDEFKDTSKLAVSYKDLGDIYHSQGDDEPKSVEYLLKAVRLSESVGDKRVTAACYNNIALAFRRLEEYDKAIQYIEKSIELKKELGNKRSLVFSYVNIGIIYSRTQQPDKALSSYNKALDLALESNNKVHIAAIYENIGLVYKDKKEFNKARKATQKALKGFREIGDGVGVAISYYNLAELEKDMKNYISGLNYAEQSLNKSLEINSAEQILDSYKIFYELHYLTNNYKKAFEYLELYKNKSDSVFNKEKHNQITEMQTKYETEKKEKQIAVLEKEQILNEKTIELQQFTIYSVVVILIIVIVSIYVLYKQYKTTQKANKELVKKNLELMRTEQVVFEIKKEEPKYSDNVKQEILDRLTTLIEEEKVYKTQKLGIDTLAKDLNTNRTYLSEIINEVYETNFNQFINSRRVIEARKMLINPEYEIYTIESIAQEVGFSSKSVFNESFKKFTGISPSFFRKNALKKSA